MMKDDDEEFCMECGDPEFDEYGKRTHNSDDYDHDFEYLEYCSVCGDAEFDEDGEETHVDEEYDHDFRPEEGASPLEDIKDLADTVKSIAEAGSAVKKFTKSSKIDHFELNPNRFNVPPPTDKFPDLEIAEHPDVKAEKRHKETIKWVKIAIIAGIVVGIVAIIFN